MLTSPYCRCKETAQLAFGKGRVDPLLSAGEDLEVVDKEDRGGAVRAMLNTAPAAGLNSVLITHTGTLLYSFGLDSRPEGIAHVFRPGPVRAIYVGRLEPADWPTLAAGKRP